jgi:diguanylate cyclase (GGDEF)-like protein
VAPRLRIQARLAAIFVALVCAPIVLGVWLLEQSATKTQQSSLDQRLILDLQIARRQFLAISSEAGAQATAAARRPDVQRALMHRNRAAIRRIERADRSLELHLGAGSLNPVRRGATLLGTSKLTSGGHIIGRVGVFVGLDDLLTRLGSPPSAALGSGVFVARGGHVIAGPSGLRGTATAGGTETLPIATHGIRVVSVPFAAGSPLRLGVYGAAAASGYVRRWQFLVAAIVLLLSAAGAMLVISRSILSSISQLANAAEQADTDALTGLSTRRGFRRQVDLELRRSARSGALLSIVVADLDYFKAINDRYGHGAGDAVLVNFAHAVRRALRDVDVAARYGGEEFSILLPSAGLSDAARVAERIRSDFARTPTQIRDGSTIYASSSFGVAQFGSSWRTIDDVLHAADAALYKAKAAGRDCVMLAEAPPRLTEVGSDAAERRGSS